MLIVPKSHPLAQKESVSLSEIENEKLIAINANSNICLLYTSLEEETSFSFDRPIDMDAVDVNVQLNMELNPPAVLAAGGMGLLIVALSAGLSFLVIVRCRPKELLTVME